MATLKQLAELIDARIVGDEALDIQRLAPIDSAGRGDITFIANPKYLAALKTTAASAVLVDHLPDRHDIAYLICKNPYLAFAKLLTALHVVPAPVRGVMAGCWVDPSARIGERVSIYPGTSVGADCVIGDDTILYPNVVIYPHSKLGKQCVVHSGVVLREGCVLGDRVIVQPNAVIGSDGFGFAPDGESYYKIPQVGCVVIEDDVEIGACSCIDRAAMGVTRIGAGTKLDNLVQIGHNVSVGPHTVMAAQAGIAGSTKVGRHCTLGGQSAIAGHLQIGDNLTLGGRGGITGSLPGNQVVSGVPAIPHRDWLKASMTFGRLPQLRKELIDLKRQVAELQALVKKD